MSPGSRNNHLPPGNLSAVKQRNLRLRARMTAAVRGFFADRGYLEVETPILLPAPVPEPHIHFMETSCGVLQPSPEVYMKRLLASGYPRIFQTARCFRDLERGDRHLREFTLLEWYAAGADYRDLMDTCEAMVGFTAREMGFGDTLSYQGRKIDLSVPWERITVAHAFDLYAPHSLKESMTAGRFEEDLVSCVEPRLGATRPTFLHDYPASMASLSRRCPGSPDVCERVELYLGGLEIANGFSELTDPVEQRRRFERDRAELKKRGCRDHPLPEALLEALNRMPDAAGMALGMDRLAMVFADCDRIDQVVAFTPEDG